MKKELRIWKVKNAENVTSSASKPFCVCGCDGDVRLSPLTGTNWGFDGRNFGFAGTGGGCG